MCPLPNRCSLRHEALADWERGMMWKRVAAIVVLAAVARPSVAEDVQDVAKAFGARESVQNMSLSPDGTKVAYIASMPGRGAGVLIADLVAGGQPKRILFSPGAPQRLHSCDWVTATRLICRYYLMSDDGATALTFSRQVAINSDGSDLTPLTVEMNDRSLGFAQNGGRVIDWTGDGRGTILMTRQFVPEKSTGTHLASNDDGLGVERVDTVTLNRTTVETAKREAVDYITDGRGTVRIMVTEPTTSTGYASNRTNYFFKKKTGGGWLPLSKSVSDAGLSVGFRPLAVDFDKDVAYGFEASAGRQALVSLSLDGSATKTVLLTRPDVDVDELISIGRHHRIVGASWATERRETDYFDPALRSLGKALSRALPQAPLVSFVDASADEAKLLLFAGSDTNPGRYYLLDRATHHMEEVLPARQELEGRQLGEMVPIRFPAADGTSIPGYLTLPPGSAGKHLPAIVMPHGGPGSRDEWGFDWWAQYFVARGFAVLQPNFRGSTGYGTDWFQKNGFQSWRVAIGDVNDAGRWLIAQGIADPARLAIVGWSYGGYAALQSAVLDPKLYKAIIAVAPVTDLEMLKGESAAYTNHLNVEAFVGVGPHIREGSPARNAAAISAPVLLFHGSDDRNVGIAESRLMADRLRAAGKTVELTEYRGLAHSLEDSIARTDMLVKSDAFLRAALKF
jgi:acetyl esterase/lipase